MDGLISFESWVIHEDRLGWEGCSFDFCYWRFFVFLRVGELIVDLFLFLLFFFFL